MSKRVSRWGRAQLIIQQLENVGPCQTELALAEGQGVKKTPYFRDILSDLVSDGYIIVQWAKGSNRQLTRFYSLPEQVRELPGMDSEL